MSDRPRLLLVRDDARVYYAEHRELFAVAPRREDGTVADLLCVDAPYSERTHAGHDEGVVDVFDGATTERRELSYTFWTPQDVGDFVATWAPVTRGWIVSITDHVLMSAWEDALRVRGRYVFAPLPFYWPGSGVRLRGDGPSSWTRWILVARPTTREFASWGTLPGGYSPPRGFCGRVLVPGGKPPWLLERIIEDYSRPGDVVADPCCGAGTALAAAIATGRRAIGGDLDLERAELAAREVVAVAQSPLIARALAPPMEQRDLFGREAPR